MDKKLRLAVAPFKEEWKAFNKEKLYSHDLTITDENGGIALKMQINFALKWSIGMHPDIIIKKISSPINKGRADSSIQYWCKDLIRMTTQYKEYVARIELFTTETEKMGKKEYGDTEALWDKYFHSHTK